MNNQREMGKRREMGFRRTGNGSANGLEFSRRTLLAAPLLGAPFLVTGCSTETLLSATFDVESVGGPPAFSQPVGTVSTLVGSGTVTVSNSPDPSSTDQWVKISHPSAPTPETSMKCDLSSFGGDGQFDLIATLFVPSGGAVPTVQFETFGQPVSNFLNFLHLDFLTDGTVRIDDKSSTAFGSFPHDRSFLLLVSLNISASGATASITLSGAASGSANYTIDPSLINVARQFGAVRFWMGFQFAGSYYVNDISVLRVIS
jgi:hypothetical protein